MRPSHDHDAGGNAEVRARKAEVRERVWASLEDGGASRFPGAEGRIPNFVGAEGAADRLRGLAAWAAATTLKANPDSPQWPVRQRALEDGKTVYMAVPRLAEDPPFLALDPDRLEGSPREVSSIKGASRHAERVAVDALGVVDLVVTGCVAAGVDGARLGKGGGFSDLEFAVMSEAGIIGHGTVVVTTVHELQVLEAGTVPMASHDVPLDLVVTPERVIDCRGGPHRRPEGISWRALTEEKIAAIPLLSRLRP